MSGCTNPSPESGRSETRAIKVDLGLDAPKLQAGQLYFLAPSFVR